ncbi:clan AA aspartic protease [Metallosphaera hakonensis]|uniref:Clan AA aspartic protease n=1 Tax=Metallosphaera hakonensis JCM 8857 = DSM 7519 TaxID=1293036 RepID=A0A2U9IRB9_9CREN|nr:clan AA aspartic protease [Metallosphaera hakonensis]AWR98560.1 clan AA aspartic protease [Metallosphaera hakonensis JCM 8857 = DSM 7519]
MVVDCFRIGDRPEVPITVMDIVKDISIQVNALIDTGFSGYLLLANSLYSKINSVELDESHWRTYATLNGIVRTKVARARIKIGKMELESFVESPILGRDIALMGRELLRKFSIEIKKGEKICIDDP